jgi:hypothetical protein
MLFFRKSVAAAVFSEPARIVMLSAPGNEPAPSLFGVLVYYNLVDAIERPSTSTL